MFDSYNRKIDYMRISVTDRCNLRCKYCMPSDGVDFISHNEILTYDEIIRLIKIATKLGITNIKITGGEPLVRKDVMGLIKNIKNIDKIKSVTMTTNGTLIKEHIDEIVDSKVDTINVSLDTLDKEKYKEITGFDKIDDVIEGINLLVNSNIKTRINVVALKKFNFEEIIKLSDFTNGKNIDLRFIELMPIGLVKDEESYNEEEILSILRDKYGKEIELDRKIGKGPAHYFNFEKYDGNIGFINAISHKFCSGCNRVRLTSDGKLKTCLQYESNIDLKKYLRSDSSDEEILEVLKNSILMKQKEHEFNNDKIDNKERKFMQSIGG